MEEYIIVLEDFLKETGVYLDACEQNEHWYESMKKRMLSEQELTRIANQDNRKRQQENLKKLQSQAAADKEKGSAEIRDQIKKKKELLAKSIKANQKVRDKILARKDDIVRPEFFRYAYRYKEYGDFHPEIQKLEDFQEIDLDAMVERVNDGKTALWVNELKAFFKSEDMLLEYAELANLFSKARYLCEVANDALRDTAHREMMQLELALSENEALYMEETAVSLKKQKRISQDNEDFAAMFDENCKEQLTKLREEFEGRLKASYDELCEHLEKSCSVSHLEAAYGWFEEKKARPENYICEDGAPLNAVLGRLWFTGAALMNNEYIRQMLINKYPFMVKEGRFYIPGV